MTRSSRTRPVAALTPIGSQTDLENLAVSNCPEFRALIERSETSSTTPSAH